MVAESRLLAEARRLLGETRLSMPAISAATGINIWWLRKFKTGTFNDPGVNRVEKLRDFLRAATDGDAAKTVMRTDDDPTADAADHRLT